MPSQALIIIDAQVGLIENPDAPLGDRAALLDTLEVLLADARRTGVPVVFVQDEDVGAGNAALHAIHPRIARAASRRRRDSEGRHERVLPDHA